MNNDNVIGNFSFPTKEVQFISHTAVAEFVEYWEPFTLVLLLVMISLLGFANQKHQAQNFHVMKHIYEFFLFTTENNK